MNRSAVGQTFLSAGAGDLPIASSYAHIGLDSDMRREQEVRSAGRLETLPYGPWPPCAI